MKRRIVCGLAMAVAVAFCFLKSFDVAPTHASLSGWTSLNAPNNYVAEVFIANFDSAAEVDFFVGSFDGLSATYNVDIYEHPGGYEPIAYSHNIAATKGYTWLQFPMTPDEGQKFVRGKEYKVVTRPQDSLA